MWIEIINLLVFYQPGLVTPFTGVWIEMFASFNEQNYYRVTPFTGVWIEM